MGKFLKKFVAVVQIVKLSLRIALRFVEIVEGFTTQMTENANA